MMTSRSTRFTLIVGKVCTASLICAAVGSIENSVYEWLFDPYAFSAGNPVARALFFVLLSFPFIVAGLLVVVGPIRFLLRLAGLEALPAYMVAGAATGLGLGWLIGFVTTYGTVLSVIYGGVGASLWWKLPPTHIE